MYRDIRLARIFARVLAGAGALLLIAAAPVTAPPLAPDVPAAAPAPPARYTLSDRAELACWAGLSIGAGIIVLVSRRRRRTTAA